MSVVLYTSLYPDKSLVGALWDPESINGTLMPCQVLIKVLINAAGRPSVVKAWRDTFQTQNVQAFLYPGSPLTVQ